VIHSQDYFFDLIRNNLMIIITKKSAVPKYARKLLSGSGNKNKVMAPIMQNIIPHILCLSLFIQEIIKYII